MVSLIKSYGIYILLGLLVSVSLNWYVNLGKAVTLNASSSSVQTKISNTQIKLSFSKAVKHAAPSVVNLFTSKVGYEYKINILFNCSKCCICISSSWSDNYGRHTPYRGA